MLNNLVRESKHLFNEHTELRAQSNTSCVVRLEDGKGTLARVSDKSGVFARVFKGGLYGASCGDNYDEATVRRVLRDAERLAVRADERCRIGEGPMPAGECGTVELDRVLKPLDRALHFEYARRIDDYIKTKYPDLCSRGVTVRSECIEKNLAVSNGIDAHTAIIRAYVDIDLRIEDRNGQRIEMGNYYGGNRYLEEQFETLDWLFEQIDELYRQLLDYAQAVPPKAGEYDIILSPALTGLLSHEAVGHTVEGDMVQSGSIAGLLMNERVGSDKVTLMDYAYEVPDGVAPCKVLVDDEGTRAEDCTVIENGILRRYLNSRQTARMYGQKPCGCCRANEYSDEPMIRMRNTAIAPGTDKLEDMIASIDDGYYLVGNMNGQADTSGEFVIVSSLGYEVKNGKLGRPVQGTSLSGMAFDLLKTVTMVGEKQGWRFGGICGKKQIICNATGGPAIKCRANIAGK